MIIMCDSTYSVCLDCSDHYTLPKAGTLNYFNWVGGGTGREVKGEDCEGEGAWWEWAIVKGQFFLGALPMGRCASPPPCRWPLAPKIDRAT